MLWTLRDFLSEFRTHRAGPHAVRVRHNGAWHGAAQFVNGPTAGSETRVMVTCVQNHTGSVHGATWGESMRIGAWAI